MSNGILVDQLEEDLADNLTGNVEVEQEEAPDQSAQEGDNFEMPEKFRGKTAEEIAKIYLEEQSYRGKLENQLGEYRQMTDRLLNLEEKRVSDLEKGGAENVDYDIDPTELLSNPKEVLDAYISNKLSSDESYSQLQERLDAIERQTLQEKFNEKHPDVQQLATDPQFQAWVNANPYRSNMAAQAVQNQDYASLDYLLTDYKERQGDSAAAEPDNQKANEVRRAKSVVTESSSSGGTSNSGKVYSRREIVNMKIHRPKEWEARQHEFTQAYLDGRVTD